MWQFLSGARRNGTLCFTAGLVWAIGYVFTPTTAIALVGTNAPPATNYVGTNYVGTNYPGTNYPGTNYVTNCVVSGVSTSCLPGMLYFSGLGGTSSNCVGQSVSLSPGMPYFTDATVDITTSYSNCPAVTTTMYASPSILSQSYVVNGPYGGSGSGGTATFTPTAAGVGSVTFTITYDDGCGGIQTIQVGGYYSVGNCTGGTNTTNCVVSSQVTNCAPGSISYPGATNAPGTNCAGSTVTVSLGSPVPSPGSSQVITYYTDPACPPVTNSAAAAYPTVLGISWTAGGAYTGSGSGANASFIPTSAGSGSVTFTITYDNGCGGTATTTAGGSYYVSQCATNSTNCVVSSRSTNCVVPGSVTLTPATNSVEVCQGASVSASATSTSHNGQSTVVTYYSNCPPTTVTNTVSPVIISNWWVASGPGTFTASGSGLSASYTPTNAGSGSVTFYTLYSNPPPCSASGTASTSVGVTVHAVTTVTNCALAPSISLVAGTNNILTNCFGSPISASARAQYTTGRVEIITSSTSSNCPNSRVTNYVTSTLKSNWWTASGPGGFTAGGSGLSASFTPTNSGGGSLTFYLQYSNPPPCAGSTTVTLSYPYLVHSTSKTTNCLLSPSITLNSGTNNVLTNCFGYALSASVTAQYNTGKVEIVTTSSSTNCPNSRVTNNVTSTIRSNWWVVSGPGSYSTNGTGLSASFTPTNSGSGTITFYLQYSNPPPCGTGSNPIVNRSFNFLVHGVTKTSNCLAEASIQFTNLVGSLPVALGNQVTGSVSHRHITGRVEVVTASTSTNCPTTRVTNSYSSTVLSNWWVAAGPGGYTNTGSGLSAAFTPTNAGHGKLTFYTRYRNQSPCTASNLISISTNYTVFKAEILDRNGNLLTGTNYATNAVRYVLKSRIFPSDVVVTYLWKINGGVPAANVAIKTYSHILADSEGNGWRHTPTNMATMYMTNSEIDFFWSRPGTPTVTLEVRTNSAVFRTNHYVIVVNAPDPNRHVYSRASPDIDHNPDGSGSFYDVCTDHGDWHGGPKYDSGMGLASYRGAKFFIWHKSIIDLHQAWRSTFGITTIIDPTIGTTKPSYFTTAGGSSSSHVYKYVRLDEYPYLEQLGDDIHHWHNAGHNNLATIGSTNVGNTPDIERTDTNLRGSNNVFWGWHSNIEALRAPIPLGASPATVVNTLPTNGAPSVPNGGTSIQVIFNKPVSINGPQAAAATNANRECTLPSRMQLIPPGGGAAITATAVSASADWKTHTFTVPAMTNNGVWTVRLTGTARGYRGVTNTFTVLP